MRPAARARVLCCLFSNCYLVLFDKEKGVVCLCVFLCSPETPASLPLFLLAIAQVLAC